MLPLPPIGSFPETMGDSMYTLYFGNCNYSSWSLRPWLLMRHFAIPFTERQVEVLGQGPNERHRGYSPNGLVPCLHVDGFEVWDTLAIAEFLAERHAGLWVSIEMPDQTVVGSVK